MNFWVSGPWRRRIGSRYVEIVTGRALRVVTGGTTIVLVKEPGPVSEHGAPLELWCGVGFMPRCPGVRSGATAEAGPGSPFSCDAAPDDPARGPGVARSRPRGADGRRPVASPSRPGRRGAVHRHGVAPLARPRFPVPGGEALDEDEAGGPGQPVVAGEVEAAGD